MVAKRTKNVGTYVGRECNCRRQFKMGSFVVSKKVRQWRVKFGERVGVPVCVKVRELDRE